MTLKHAAWLLLVAGVLALAYGLGMDTSVDGGFDNKRLHNLSLAARQSAMLMLGGFVFLAGVILFSVFELKQTKQDEQDEEAARAARIATTKKLVNESIQGAGGLTKLTARTAGVWLRRRHEGTLRLRIAVGLFVGICLATMIAPFSSLWSLAMLIGVVVVTLASENIDLMARQLLFVNGVAYLLVTAVLVAIALSSSEKTSLLVVAFVAFIPVVISWIATKRLASNASSTELR